MFNSEPIKNNMKLWLNIQGTSEDALLELLITTSAVKITGYCHRLDSEIDTDEKLKTLVMYDAILSYNKRTSEGIKSSSTAGFGVNYDIEPAYKMLLSQCNKVKVI